MACEYCNGTKPLVEPAKEMSFKGDFFPGIDLFIDCGVLYYEVRPDTYEPAFMEGGVEIKFCPMCGRKL